MAISIDSLLHGAKMDGLEITDRNEESYKKFILDYQKTDYDKIQEIKKQTDLHYRLILDKTLLLGYIMGDILVQINKRGNRKRIEKKEDLKLISANGRYGELWNDTILYALFSRRIVDRTKNSNFPTYVQIINELGQYETVIDKFQGQIDYNKDIKKPIYLHPPKFIGFEGVERSGLKRHGRAITR